jgi:L-ribulose-5-phosphate 3-epimerase
MLVDKQAINRRTLLVRSVQAATFALAGAAWSPLLAAPQSRRFKIGACEWMLGRPCNPASLTVAKEIGLDGVQVDMGTVANDMHLRRPQVQKAYLEASKRTGVAIASLAEAAFWDAPLRTDPRAAKWLDESIDVCKALGVTVTMPACFELDMNDKPGIDHFVAVLKKIAPKAEKLGVTIGLENWLSAEDHRRLLDRIGSPAVKVYYDVGNSTDKGRNILKEIRSLGKLICEFHFKDGRHLLGQGRIDFKQVRKALDDIRYSGWLNIEAAAPNGVVADYTTQLKFLRGPFPSASRVDSRSVSVAR